MAGAFVDGALKGFEMMERHQARKDNKARLADIDKREDLRYQQTMERQARIDEERAKNQERDFNFRESQAESASDYRNQTLEANKQQRQWQQNYQTQQAQWQKDQQAIPIAVQSFRETGKIPEELEETMRRNKGLDPRTYLKEEYRNAVKELDSNLNEVIKSGSMAKVNNPETIKLFDKVFGDKLKASVGQYDDVVKSKIASVDFAGFVPAEREDGSVALALQVTYENGAKEIKPMTKGRTSEGDDPVMTYTPKELVSTIKSRAMMADMIERPEYWDKMGAQIGASFGRDTKASSDRVSSNDYQKQLSSIQDEMTKALAKVASGSDTDYMGEDSRAAASKRIKELYESRVRQLKEAYGVPVEDGGKSVDIDNLSDDELIEQLTGALGAQ